MSIFLIQLFFRCHEERPLIHTVGWARRVGHQVVANQDYFDRCAMDNLLTTDCTPDMFPEYRQAHMTNLLPGTHLQIIIDIPTSYFYVSVRNLFDFELLKRALIFSQ